MSQSIKEFSQIQFPSSSEDTLSRRAKFTNYLESILPTDLSANYSFVKVVGDGSCFFHSILRYFGYLTWQDLPNKDTTELDEHEQLVYQFALSNLREMSTEYIREFTGDSTFVLDPNVPEYQLICKYISDTTGLRIIVLEYDGYKPDSLNKVGQFLPESDNHIDTAILINFSHHFTLIFPTSTDPKYDTKTIRRLVGDELVTKAFLNGKMF